MLNLRLLCAMSIRAGNGLCVRSSSVFLPLRRIACHGTKLRIRITAFVVASAQKRMWPGHSDLAPLARRGRFLHEAAKEFPRLGCTALIGCQDGCRLRKLRFLQKRHREYSACFLYQ